MGDRIVVMKGGFIQQVDSPKNLYRYPINKFVAGFIGSPQLTFVDAYLTKENDKIKLSVKDTDVTLMIPEDYLIKVDPVYFDGQTLVSFGIRSEHVSIEKDRYDSHIKARIASIEELGTEIQLFVNLDIDKDVFFVAGDDSETIRTDITLKADADYNGHIGDIIDISLDLQQLHLFDADTEEVINPRIPDHARVKGVIKNKKLSFCGLSIELSEAFDDLNGEYSITIPTDSVQISENGQEMKIYNVEKVEKQYLLTFKDKDGAFFLLTDEEYKKGDTVKLDFDIKSFDFYEERRLAKPRLNIFNEITGTAYYHKEKDDSGKKIKVLDYIIDDEEYSCHNPIAHRIFITNKDRSLYDIDLSFKFDAYQIHLDENGPFEIKPIKILKYKEEKFLLCEYKETKLIIYIEDENIDLNNTLKARIDIDDIQVFDKERNIRLV